LGHKEFIRGICKKRVLWSGNREENRIELGMIGLGRMGTNMVRPLRRAGHQCVVYDIHPEPVDVLGKEGAVGTKSLGDFAKKLKKPRSVWLMIPAAVVDPTSPALGLIEVARIEQRINRRGEQVTNNCAICFACLCGDHHRWKETI